MKKTHPSISIIIPVYNAEKFLPELLYSIEHQTFSNFECIFINDASTDSSAHILESFCEQFSYAQTITQTNQGPSATRNKGLSLATGEYVFFADADDKLSLNALENLYQTAKQFKADLVIGGTERFNTEKNWKVHSHFMPTGPVSIHHTRKLYWTMGPCNKLYKRTLIQTLQFPLQFRYAEDLYFVMNCYLHATNIVALNKTVYYYRTHDSSEHESLVQVAQGNPEVMLSQIQEIWHLLQKDIRHHCSQTDYSFIEYELMRRLLFVDIVPPLKKSPAKLTEKLSVLWRIYRSLRLSNKLKLFPYLLRIWFK